MFRTRLLSGIVLLVVMVTVFVLGSYPLWALLLGVSLIAYHELVKALGGITEKHHRPNVPETAGMIGTAIYYIVILFYHDAIHLVMAIAGFLLIMLFVYVQQFPNFEADEVSHDVFAFLYAPVMLSFIYLTRSIPDLGKYMVWLIIISSWGCDTCAYCVGKLIGKHKAFPILSPHKSIEGCFGGAIGATLIGFLYGLLYIERRVSGVHVAVPVAMICGLGGIISMIGDLAASAIKRNKGIKDYGTLIPGHGGIMDRFDSMIITAPATFILSILLLG